MSSCCLSKSPRLPRALADGHRDGPGLQADSEIQCSPADSARAARQQQLMKFCFHQAGVSVTVTQILASSTVPTVTV